MPEKLERFKEAHRQSFYTALSEIKKGKKTSHWMWYVFPQLCGLGMSETSRYFAIENLAEAQEIFDDHLLGENLLSITLALLSLPTNDPQLIFGSTDKMKLQSCMTLFSLIERSHPVFQQVLNKYFQGKSDLKTVQLLRY